MRVIGIGIGALIMLATMLATARAQVCNPDCATQPAACCAQPQADQFLAEECTGGAANLGVHFVITNGTAWVDNRTPATFDVSGVSGSIELGDVMPVPVAFTIGTSATSARFQVVDDSLPLTVIGQCVGVSGVTYAVSGVPGLPKLASVDGRALQVLKTNTLYCRQAGHPDTLCLNVKGQVGPPFQAQQLCDPDRVEFLCADVS